MTRDKQKQDETKQEEKHKNDENSSKNKDKLLEEKDVKICELINDLKRLKAEFENYQKRMDKQNEEYRQFASASLLQDLLPVLDSLEIGLKHNKEFVMIYEQLFSIMKKKGIEKIDVNVGEPFNHELMDCLMQESNKQLENGVVAQVLSTGYKLNGKILRTSKISINKLDEKMVCEEKQKKNDENIESKDRENNEINDKENKLNNSLKNNEKMEDKNY